MGELMLVAAGGLARETIAAVRSRGAHRVVGLLDDDENLWGTIIDGVPVLGSPTEATHHPEARFVICAGRGSTRAALAERIERIRPDGVRYARVVHPSIEIPAGSHVGQGSILLAGVVLTADVLIGSHSVIMPNVTLTHGARLHPYATLCAGVTLGGNVEVGSAAYLGMNASVRENVRIGDGAILGMGSVLLVDLPGHQTWVGAPAAPISRRDPVRLFPVRTDLT